MRKILIVVLIVVAAVLIGVLVWQNWPKPAPFVNNQPQVDLSISCIAEGEQGGVEANIIENRKLKNCCEGLNKVDLTGIFEGNCENASGASMGTLFTCIACGDGTCGKGENQCNCPSDCRTVEGSPTIKNDPTIEPIIFALNKTYADKFFGWEKQADKIIDDINFVFAKTTSKKFKISKYLVYNDNEYTKLFANPEQYPEYYNDVGSRGGITYILLVLKDGITNQEIAQLYGSNNINVMQNVYSGDKIYPTILQAHGESANILLDEVRLIGVQMPIHELGHCLGVAVPDWYLFSYSDCTGLLPNFRTYSIQEDPSFSKDPMVTTLRDINIMQFNELSSAIINRNSNLLYTYDYIRLNWFSKITKIYVTDKFGTPISNAIVKIFCIRRGCLYCDTKCGAALEDSLPEQTLVADKSGYAIYSGPVGGWVVWGEIKDAPCLAKAIKVYHNDKSGVETVNFIDLQKNYILNNANEYITHIVLE